MKNQYWSQPLPEEFIAGFFGRLSWINFKKSTLDFLASSGNNNSLCPRSPLATELAVICAAIGIEQSSLIQLHTLLPLFEAITASSIRTSHGDNLLSFSNWAKVSRSQHGYGAFCSECAKEDLDFHGLSYWRRQHQIPGIFWCEKHMGTLLRQVRHPHAFEISPDQWDVSFVQPPSLLLPSVPFPLYERYREICGIFLDRRAPLSLDLVRSVLRKRIFDGSENDPYRPGKPVISDLVLQQSAQEWMYALFPNWYSKRKWVTFSGLDGVRYCTAPLSIAAYVLSFAALFDCPNEELSLLFQLQSRVPNLIKGVDLDLLLTPANNHPGEEDQWSTLFTDLTRTGHARPTG